MLIIRCNLVKPPEYMVARFLAEYGNLNKLQAPSKPNTSTEGEMLMRRLDGDTIDRPVETFSIEGLISYC